MPKEQLHKRLSDEQVKALIRKYISKELKAHEVVRYLDVGRTRFYQLVTAYEENTADFSVKYERTAPTNTIEVSVEKNILKELRIEKEKIVDNPAVAIRHYNYSYIRSLLWKKYEQKVSLPTVIDRAKKHGFWKKVPVRRVHDREVLTNYPGEIIQHDSSLHLWAPEALQKWYLITSLDDYSRMLVYADLWTRESSWNHIQALESVFLRHGFPLSYYADQHSIFRYVKNRDKQSPWATYTKFTDDVDPQWRQVLKECGVKPLYALSPQAKGKIERPYEWLQDHLVRTCAREGVKTIEDAKEILQDEIHQYNTKRIHATTKEIPIMRMRNALKEGKTLFRPFAIPEPYRSTKDIFSLRIPRIVDSYRKISLKKFVMTVPGVPCGHEVDVRLSPNEKSGLTEVRFWYKGHLTGSQKVKNDDLPIVRF